MLRNFILPMLAVAGVASAAYTVSTSSEARVPAPPQTQPARTPFTAQVAGAGLIEASTENIAVGAVVPGVVTEVAKRAGDAVHAGDLLFRIDDRELRAELDVALASLTVKQRHLDLLKAQPREANLAPIGAQIAAADATHANRQRELKRLQGIGESASRDELENAQWQERVASAEVDQAKARYAQEEINVRAWQQAVAAAEAEVSAADAEVRRVRVELDRRSVCSPIDGTVLQVKVRVGEYAQVGPLATPLMLVGDVDTLQVRVDIDESDAWRVRDGAKARAFVRGNADLATDLSFFRIEPYVVPKRSLTGDSAERVDTRVLQVLYRFKASDFVKSAGVRLYPGQQLDVFIDAAK